MNLRHITRALLAAALASLAPLSIAPAQAGGVIQVTSASISSTPTAKELLNAIPVAAEPRRSGYSRDLFTHWVDADGNGCDTRREVLVAEAVTRPRSCLDNRGVWLSVYDNVKVTDARKLDVDHVVALAEAWDSGARNWDASRRQAFANDLDSPWSLIAVTAGSNRSKSDHDMTRWKPSTTAGRCWLATATVITKWRWSLTVDSAEASVLRSTLNGCASAPITLPTRVDGVAAVDGPAPTVPAAPDATPQSGVDPINGVCSAPHLIKGNISSSARIYHQPGTSYYNQTQPEVCFATTGDAEAAGFRAPR